MNKRIIELTTTKHHPERIDRWKQLRLLSGMLFVLCVSLCGYTTPRLCKLVATYPGQYEITKISVNTHGFLHVIPQRRVAQYHDWHGHLLAEYRMPARKSRVPPLAAISPDGRTVAMLEIYDKMPYLLRQWHDKHLLYQRVVNIPVDSGGFPELIARNNGDLLLLLHDEYPLYNNYYEIGGLALIRRGKTIAVQSPWKQRFQLSIDSHTIIPGTKFQQLNVSGGKFTIGHRVKAVLPPAAHTEGFRYSALSSNATWAMIPDGDENNSIPTKRVTAWNLRTGKSWKVVLPRQADSVLGAITNDGQYMALREDINATSTTAKLTKSLTAYPVIRIYQRPGRCCAMLPAGELAKMYDDTYHWQIYVMPEHKKLMFSDSREIRLYKW